MKWILLAGVVVAAGLILRALYRQQIADCVSPDWLFEQARRDEQNTFEGQSISWPINKAVNEAGLFNSRRLRQRA